MLNAIGVKCVKIIKNFHEELSRIIFNTRMYICFFFEMFVCKLILEIIYNLGEAMIELRRFRNCSIKMCLNIGNIGK